MKRAAIYVRCSTETQTDSTRQQIDELSRYAASNGYEIVQTYEDFGRSGTTVEGRPAFQKMIEDVEHSPNFESVLVWDMSRWSRANDPRESIYWKKHLQRFKVALKVVNSNSRDEDDVGSCVTEIVESAQSGDYVIKLRVTTKRGLKANAQRGFFCGGYPPLGYRRIAVDKVSGAMTRELHLGQHINPDSEKSKLSLGPPQEVELVKRIFEERAKGTSCAGIANMFNAEGIPSPGRGRWMGKSRRWTQGAVKAITENMVYQGDLVYNRRPEAHLSGPSKELWINPMEKWVIAENAVPAIVSRELFALVNRNRKPYMRVNRHFAESPYLLSGLIFCLKCGYPFQGQTYAKKKHRTYQDSSYISRGKVVCPSCRMSAEPLERFVIDKIRRQVLNSDLPKILEQELNNRLKKTTVSKTDSINAYSDELNNIEKKIRNLMTLAENGIRMDVQIDRLKELQDEKDRVEEKIEELQYANISRKDMVDARQQVEYLLANFDEVIRLGSLAMQKELLRRFVQKIVVDREADAVKVYLRKIPVLNNAVPGSSETLVVTKKVTERRGKGKRNVFEKSERQAPKQEAIVLAKDQ